jgi:diacylglycerol kinase family enzyme
VNTIRAKEVTLIRENEESPVHIDGTPTKMKKELHIKIVEAGLKVLVKKRY